MGKKKLELCLYEALPSDFYGIVIETKGRNIFKIRLSDDSICEALLPNKFRGLLWIRRGSFVVLRLLPEATEPSIIHILSRQDIKQLVKEGQWPHNFNSNNMLLYDQSSDSYESFNSQEEYE